MVELRKISDEDRADDMDNKLISVALSADILMAQHTEGTPAFLALERLRNNLSVAFTNMNQYLEETQQ